MITLVRALPEDVPALLDIQKQAFAAILEKYQDYDTNPAAESVDRMQWKLERPDRDYWFIMDADRPVGMIGVRHGEETLHVSPIGLIPECQGKGIGHQAMILLEKAYPQNRRWELSTILQESGLCRFYERLGYCRTGEQWNIQPGMDEVGYKKRIGG